MWRTWKLCTSEISLGKSFQFLKRNSELPDDLVCQLAFHRCAKIHENNKSRKKLFWLTISEGAVCLHVALSLWACAETEHQVGSTWHSKAAHMGTASKQRQEGDRMVTPPT